MDSFAQWTQIILSVVTLILLVPFALLCIVSILVVLKKNAGRKSSPEFEFKITNVSKRESERIDVLQRHLLSKEDLKQYQKVKKQEDKQDKAPRKRLFVFDFQGDIAASDVAVMREVITLILKVQKKNDEVLLRLESPGGLVTGYGLAAAELARCRKAGVPLTISVDKVAASGGYLMACVANRIISAPFAVLGSIGVVAGLPNLHRILKKNDVDYYEMTAGEHKRTMTMFGEVTEKKREKFQDQLNMTHTLFKDFVRQNRPQLDIGAVSTGDYWMGTQALDLALVDEVLTSEEFLDRSASEFDIYEIKALQDKSPFHKILGLFTQLGTRLLFR